jgi:ribonuclease VapC
MMIDSSAILAIAFQEPEAERMATAIAAASTRKMCAVNWLETLMVVEGRYGPESADDTLLLLQELGVEPISFDRNQMIEARTAWRRFGKGHHPASLNLGDCCAYAASVTTAEPLLYKGNDFPQTDVARAEW